MEVVNNSTTAMDLVRSDKCWRQIVQKLAIRGTKPLGNSAGIFNFLRSEMNRNAAAARINLTPVDSLAMDEGYELVRRFYPKPYNGSYENGTVNYCKVQGKTRPYVRDKVALKMRHVSQPLVIDGEFVRCSPETKMQILEDRLSLHIEEFIRGLATKVGRYVAQGGFVGRVPGQQYEGAYQVPFFDTTGKVIPQGLAMIEELFEIMEAEKPVLVANSQLSLAKKVMMYQGCNTCTGVDAAALNSELSGIMVKDATFGKFYNGNNNVVAAIAPGALRLVTRANHKGDRALTSENQIRRTMIEPITGLEIDVLWQRDICENTISESYQFMVDWDVFGYPACWTEDPCFKGVTDVVAIELICTNDPQMCDYEWPVCTPDAPLEGLAPICPDGSDLNCATPCQSNFNSMVSQNKIWIGNKAPVGAVTAILMNSVEMPITSALVTDPVFFEELKRVIAMVGGKVLNFVADPLEIVLSLPPSVSSLALVEGMETHVIEEQGIAAGAVVCFNAGLSRATVGKEITNMTWDMGGGVIISGAPGDPVGLPGFYGTVSNFCADPAELGDAKTLVTLTIEDGVCTSAFTGINYDCLPEMVVPDPEPETPKILYIVDKSAPAGLPVVGNVSGGDPAYTGWPVAAICSDQPLPTIGATGFVAESFAEIETITGGSVFQTEAVPPPCPTPVAPRKATRKKK